jgi:hypothetical protein
MSNIISEAGKAQERDLIFCGRRDFKGDQAAEKVSKDPCLSSRSKLLPPQQPLGQGCRENVSKETQPCITPTPRVLAAKPHTDPH